MATIKVPATFVIDHWERGLPTPKFERKGAGLLICADDPAIDDLKSDAAFYADKNATDAPASLRRAAAALLSALAAWPPTAPLGE